MRLGGLLGGQDDGLKRSERFGQPNEMVVQKLRRRRTLFHVALEALREILVVTDRTDTTYRLYIEIRKRRRLHRQTVHRRVVHR